MRKTLPHQKWVSSSPPSVGPMMMPTAGHTAPDHAAMACGGARAAGTPRSGSRAWRASRRSRRAPSRSWPRSTCPFRSRKRPPCCPARRRRAPRAVRSADRMLAVAERGRAEDQERREAQCVGVADPLQRVGPRVQHPGQSRQGRVQDGVVDHDDEQAQAQDEEDLPPPRMTRQARRRPAGSSDRRSCARATGRGGVCARSHRVLPS